MDPAASVAEVWREPPASGHLHFIVRLPGRVGSPTPNLVDVGECFTRLLPYLRNLLPGGDKSVDWGAVREYENGFIKVKWWASEGSNIEGMVSEYIYADGTVEPGLAAGVCCFPDHSSDADRSM